MKNKLWIILLIAGILLIGGAAVLYNNLSDDFSPMTDLGGGESVSNDGVQVDGQQNSDQQGDDQPGDGPADEDQTDYSAPDFSFIDNDGNEHSLSDYFGKPIILNFWASWCPPCKEEMPDFEAAYKANDDIQFIMMNVTTSSRETLEKAKMMIKAQGFTFPVFYDVEGVGSSTYGTYSIPMTFFIDANGDLVTYAKGMLNAETLEVGMDMLREGM